MPEQARDSALTIATTKEIDFVSIFKHILGSSEHQFKQVI